ICIFLVSFFIVFVLAVGPLSIRGSFRHKAGAAELLDDAGVHSRRASPQGNRESRTPRTRRARRSRGAPLSGVPRRERAVGGKWLVEKDEWKREPGGFSWCGSRPGRSTWTGWSKVGSRDVLPRSVPLGRSLDV